MIVAGFGFRGAATTDSLRDALSQASARAQVDALATLDDKADAPAFQDLVSDLNLPLVRVRADKLAQANTSTQSVRSRVVRDTGSVAEATALIAAGPDAQLINTRAISDDRMATCAVAQSQLKGETI